MTLLRCLAIDDEPFALRVLADDLRQIPALDLVGTFSSPLRATELIQEGQVDLLFLDIQMPTLMGTTFLRTLQKPPLVIFTTAYEQYALESYELDVVDYLLKPIRFERLYRACNKAVEVHQQRGKPAPTPPQADTFFFVFSEYKEVKIYHHDVLYIEGLKDYVKIFLASQPRPILTRLNMKGIEARLDSPLFCRVHQSYIVPLARITAFHKTKLLLNGSTEIPVGGRYADEFLVKYRGE
jgi:DNA-binding LytR/AlgR family response regulator